MGAKGIACSYPTTKEKESRMSNSKHFATHAREISLRINAIRALRVVNPALAAQQEEKNVVPCVDCGHKFTQHNREHALCPRCFWQRTHDLMSEGRAA